MKRDTRVLQCAVCRFSQGAPRHCVWPPDHGCGEPFSQGPVGLIHPRRASRVLVLPPRPHEERTPAFRGDGAAGLLSCPRQDSLSISQARIGRRRGWDRVCHEQLEVRLRQICRQNTPDYARDNTNAFKDMLPYKCVRPTMVPLPVFEKYIGAPLSLTSKPLIGATLGSETIVFTKGTLLACGSKFTSEPLGRPAVNPDNRAVTGANRTRFDSCNAPTQANLPVRSSSGVRSH